jgi:hypothetical protein
MKNGDNSIDVASEGSRWASVVPETFYDLIARVPAGAFLILGGLWSFQLFSSTGAMNRIEKMNWAPATILLLLMLGASYSLAILLTNVGALVHRLLNRNLWINIVLSKEQYKSLIDYFDIQFGFGFQRDEKDKKLQIERLKPTEFAQLDRQMHDFLKSINSEAKLILPKMRAEAALCNHLAAAAILLIVLILGTWLLNALGLITLRNPIKTEGLVLGSIVLCLSALASPYRHKRLIYRQLSYLALYRHNVSGELMPGSGNKSLNNGK